MRDVWVVAYGFMGCDKGCSMERAFIERGTMTVLGETGVRGVSVSCTTSRFGPLQESGVKRKGTSEKLYGQEREGSRSDALLSIS